MFCMVSMYSVTNYPQLRIHYSQTNTIVKHIQRTNYQTKIRGDAFISNPSLPSPAKQGWYIKNNIRSVNWMDNPSASETSDVALSLVIRPPMYMLSARYVLNWQLQMQFRIPKRHSQRHFNRHR